MLLNFVSPAAHKSYTDPAKVLVAKAAVAAPPVHTDEGNVPIPEEYPFECCAAYASLAFPSWVMVEMSPVSFDKFTLSRGSIVVMRTAANTPRIAITTISSMSVKPFCVICCVTFFMDMF